MAPLAGRPPFATDEPESFYESSPAPQRRVRQPAPPDPNKRTSAYDVYEDYLGNDKNMLSAPPADGPSRNSGIGAMLLNMGDDSDSDDDDDVRRKPTNPPGINSSPSKHAALAAATGAASSTRPGPPPQQQQQQPPQQRSPQQAYASPQMRQQPMRASPPPNERPQPGPQPIAAPRPGYAAPIAALNLARPEPAAAPGGRGPMPNGQPRLENPFEPPFATQIRPPFASPASPAPSVHSTPHPLLPPVTPITPAFIRPSKSPAPANVKFQEGATPRKAIVRGDSEDTLLPSRGEKGDDFWRRFSIVAKEEDRKPSTMKESSWLRQMRSGSNRHSRWVWIVGIILILCIGGGVGLGIYMSRNAPDHQQPTVLGGPADNLASAVATSTPPSGGGTASKTSTRLHVSPTNTVERRDLPSAAPVLVLALRTHGKRRLDTNTDAW